MTFLVEKAVNLVGILTFSVRAVGKKGLDIRDLGGFWPGMNFFRRSWHGSFLWRNASPGNSARANKYKMQNTKETKQTAPRWGDGTRWNSGARWPAKAPQTKPHSMATVTTNIAGLTILERLNKGGLIITASTNNPLVPGNAAPLAEFSTAQADYLAASTAVDAARDALKQLVTTRDAAGTVWVGKLNQLAGFTESATNGDAAAIQSAGFGVRGPKTPSIPLPAPDGVLAKTNGSPGVTKLSWNPMEGAVLYVVQQSPTPITAESWAQVAMSTKASCETATVEPGKEYWFRIAG